MILTPETLNNKVVNFAKQDFEPTNDENTVMNFDLGGALSSIGNAIGNTVNQVWRSSGKRSQRNWRKNRNKLEKSWKNNRHKLEIFS